MKIAVALLVIGFAAAAQAGCKGRWFHAGNKCFYLEKAKKTNADAAKNCAAKGGKLARISSLIEQEAVQATLVTSNAGNAWIVYNDKRIEGAHSNEGNIFTNWNRGEPNNARNEDSVHMYKNSKWNDISVNKKYRFVCQIWGRRPGWTQYGAKSLKLFTNSQTLNGAQAECKRQLGRLVEIESLEENGVVRALDKSSNALRIGNQDVEHEGLHIIDSHFKYWSPNEPNNSHDEDCTELRQIGKWNDVNCAKKLASLCSYSLKI
ncbi:macrophage mannose receptor 1-like [Tubulanus polymorphus]|uniref:macrophage mannose receptor 1-like n=1 Tax=Tubulanus polymorphus TaxID=672921 RepID=UPI003DA3560D